MANDSKRRITTYVWTTTKCVCKFGLKSYEESWTHNCQEVFIYNALFFGSKLLDCPYRFLLWLVFKKKGSLVSSQVFNLWPPPYRTSPFHRTLELGPLSQVPFMVIPFLGTIKVDLYVKRVWNPHSIKYICHGSHVFQDDKKGLFIMHSK
jgi:hypothetical protein